MVERGICYIWLVSAMLLLVVVPANGITLSMESGGGSQRSFLTESQDLDASANLLNQAVLAGGSIQSAGHISGQGSNDQARLIGNGEQTAFGTISSSGLIESAASTYASGGSLSLVQNVNALGRSETEVNGMDSTRSAFQKAGVLCGGLSSSQSISLQDESVVSSQMSSIAGALGYADAAAASSADSVKATGGLNGIGTVQGKITASTSDIPSISGNVQESSTLSNAYSAVKTMYDGKDGYSYLSSDDQLSSDINARSGSDANLAQNLIARGNVQVYTSTNDDLFTRQYDARDQDLSGSTSAASAGSLSAEMNQPGEVGSTTSNLVPTPGSWVWSYYGGYINANPSLIQDASGKDFCFVRGEDNGLWALTGNNWYGLGGYITSDPSAVKDSQGRIHTLVRGSDNSLWDNVLDSRTLSAQWIGLGGIISSSASAAIDPSSTGRLKIVVRGSDNSLWGRDLNTGDMSGGWYGLGGIIASNPNIIFDLQNNFHVFVRDSNNAVEDLKGTLDYNGNYQAAWHSLGGSITSDAKPVLDPRFQNGIDIVARGSDGKVVTNVLNTLCECNSWYGSNAAVSAAGSGSSVYQANPVPVMDNNRNLHVLYRGEDGGLWDAVGTPVASGYTFNSYSLGGYITSDPSALWDKNMNKIKAAARGGDGSLWVNTVG